MNTKKYRVCGDLKSHMVDIGVDGDSYEVKLSYLQNPTGSTTLASSETESVASDSPHCCEEEKKLVSSAA
jgi:hypothetical protein